MHASDNTIRIARGKDKTYRITVRDKDLVAAGVTPNEVDLTGRSLYLQVRDVPGSADPPIIGKSSLDGITILDQLLYLGQADVEFLAADTALSVGTRWWDLVEVVAGKKYQLMDKPERFVIFQDVTQL